MKKMKKMKNYLKLIFITAVLSFSLFSCKKTTNNEATAKDVRVADLAVSDVFTYSSSETDNSKSFESTDGMTVNTTIDVDSLSWITTITFDNCLPADGILRNGSIIIKWEIGWFWDSTKTTTVTFDNFSRDSMSISGELQIKHSSSIKDGLIVYPENRIEEKNMVLSFPDKSTFKWNGWKTVVWKSGWLTMTERAKIVYEINWHKEGTNRLGETFTGDGNNLILDMGCNMLGFTSGTINIAKGDKDEFTIDYGDGDCDGTYTITSGKRTIEVSQ